MERALCFMSMVLQIYLVVKGDSNIQRRIKQRLVDWVDKKYQMLGSTVLCAEAQMNRKRENIIIKQFAGIKLEQRSGMQVNGKRMEF